MASSPGTFAHTRAFDRAFAIPLALLYAFALGGDVILIARQSHTAAGWRDGLTIADEAVTMAFFGLQIVLLLVRHLPVAKSQGVWPRAVAVAGANFNFALLLLPRATLGAGWTIAGAVLTIGGTIAALAVLAWLGPAFSIFPEARKLVVKGPYRYVRHPLYLAEIVTTLGIMLGFRQPWAALVALGTIAFQFQRMAYEETVLREAYPAYDAYSRTTARLLPGIY
jgi:protein-S-isoprenylcysteine O-methyltransferase Ste14